MNRTNVGLNLQVSYGLDPERCESLAEELAAAWERGWAACESANCDNCYSCGAWVGHATNPYKESAHPEGAPDGE